MQAVLYPYPSSPPLPSLTYVYNACIPQAICVGQERGWERRLREEEQVVVPLVVEVVVAAEVVAVVDVAAEI